jgi:cation diffusion facilitator CzcD-associated flavoprotein CzcO
MLGNTLNQQGTPGMDFKPSIAIIGAGFGGLCAAIRLKQAGFDRLTIYERADRVGGVWHYNTYPGCACDVPAQLYSFSFEPNADWNFAFARNDEIQKYCARAADKYGIRPHLRFGKEVKSATWDSTQTRWRLTFASGETHEADVVINAAGQLNIPALPDIEGRETFAGASFHSARWRHDVELRGKRVGVIGTAASAVQLVPEVAKQAGHLTVFQRTPNYILPRRDRAFGGFDKFMFRSAPWTMRITRNRIYWWAEWMFWGAFDPTDWRARFFTTVALDHLKKQVPDPTLRAKLTPNYPIGCKRVLFSDDYYPALRGHNVSLVAEPIKRIHADGVETKSGKKRQFDALIYATGFETSAFNWSHDVIGRSGVRLQDAWKDGPEAYLGIAVAGFPNFFMTYGPNTNLGHNSIIYMIERQADYIVQCLKRIDAENLGAMEVRRVAQDDFNRVLRGALAKTSWAGECGSWYKNHAGKITNNWMGTTQEYRRLTLAPDFNDYVLHPRIASRLGEIRPAIDPPAPAKPPAAAPQAPVMQPGPQPAAAPAAPVKPSSPQPASAPPPNPPPAPAPQASPNPRPAQPPLAEAP